MCTFIFIQEKIKTIASADPLNFMHGFEVLINLSLNLISSRIIFDPKEPPNRKHNRMVEITISLKGGKWSPIFF